MAYARIGLPAAPRIKLGLPPRVRLDSESRVTTCSIFCLAVVALAATLVIACLTNSHVPFWPEKEFGFPNRNQTGNVLGLAGIAEAIGLHRLEQGRKDWWLWLAFFRRLFGALLNFSVAGSFCFLWFPGLAPGGKKSGGHRHRLVTLGALLFSSRSARQRRQDARFGTATGDSLTAGGAGRRFTAIHLRFGRHRSGQRSRKFSSPLCSPPKFLAAEQAILRRLALDGGGDGLDGTGSAFGAPYLVGQTMSSLEPVASRVCAVAP